MTRKIFIALAAVCTLQAHADTQPLGNDSVRSERHIYNKVKTQVANPSPEGVVVSSPWTDNWFVSASAGANAFIGKPLGCDDLFGRIQPTFTVALGKWFTPSVGARLAYNGLAFKDCNRKTQDYQHLHADFLWDVLGSRYNRHDFVRWSVVPYVGVGLLHNRTNSSKPFAISYGVQGQYHISKRIAATLEIGNASTFQEFDGYGKNGKFGDNLMHLSIGITANIGKDGWKRTTAKYVSDEDAYSSRRSYSTKPNKASDAGSDAYSMNDYSGLNSLRARLANKNWDGNSPMSADASADSLASGDLSENNALFNDYLARVQSGKVCIGSPVYFFFHLNTATLTEPSQSLNLDALAKLAVKYGLHITVIGAADSATGTATVNEALGTSRANFIADELIQRGVPSTQITKRSHGGIDDYSPTEANRQTKVMLHIK